MHISEILNYNYLFDSHAHINAPEFASELENIIHKAKGADVQQIFDIGVDIESSKKAIENAKRFKGIVMAYVGIDPEIFQPGSHLFEDLDKDDVWLGEKYNELKMLIEKNREFIAGIGETGIDHYWLREKEEEITNKSKKLQQKLFEIHLELAAEFQLPTTIHSRGAEFECLNLVRNYKTTGIFHSYTGDYETAVKILDAGYGLGVNGIVTFKKAEELRSMYKKILGNATSDWSPNDFYKGGIFFETDSPFLSPEGKRGQRNEPANVRDIYDLFFNFLNN